jgi:PAS domain S-box-containing protein
MQPADFKAVFDASPNPYMLLDRDLRFVAANAAYLRATGADPNSLIGRALFDAFPHDPSDPENRNARVVRESLNRVLETRAADVIAFIPYRVPRERDGSTVLEERFWSATHTPILDERGNVRLILQHTVDVTELHELRKETPATSLACCRGRNAFRKRTSRSTPNASTCGVSSNRRRDSLPYFTVPITCSTW